MKAHELFRPKSAYSWERRRRTPAPAHRAAGGRADPGSCNEQDTAPTSGWGDFVKQRLLCSYRLIAAFCFSYTVWGKTGWQKGGSSGHAVLQSNQVSSYISAKGALTTTLPSSAMGNPATEQGDRAENKNNPQSEKKNKNTEAT